MKKALFIIAGISFFCQCARKEPPIAYKEELFWNQASYATRMLNHILADSSQIIWSTGNHTSEMVPLGAVGPRQWLNRLQGICANTDIGNVMKDAIAEGHTVILVIGDGMGMTHMSLPILLNKAEHISQPTSFETIMREGISAMCTNQLTDYVVTGSAEAATAIASGSRALTSMIGINDDGYPVRTVLDSAESLGYPTGLLTDTRITHATPAGFYANILDRGDEDTIAWDLAVQNRIEVLMGGGARFFIPESAKVGDHPAFTTLDKQLDCQSGRKDKTDLIQEMQNQGYRVIASQNQMDTLTANGQPLLGLFAGDAMSAAIDRDDEPTSQPGLNRMTEVALQQLQAPQKPFFLMVECGRIDWEAHANDAGAVLVAVKEMDTVLQTCYHYYQKDPEHTLLIFTADHETGGMGISYYVDRKHPLTRDLASGVSWETSVHPLAFTGFKKLAQQKMSLFKLLQSAQSAQDLARLIETNTAFTISPSDAERVMELVIKSEIY